VANSPQPIEQDIKSRQKAADLLGIGQTSVQNAKKLTKEAPELAEKVRSVFKMPGNLAGDVKRKSITVNTTP